MVSQHPGPGPVRNVTVLGGNTVCNTGTVTVEVLSSSQSASMHPSIADKVRSLTALNIHYCYFI